MDKEIKFNCEFCKQIATIACARCGRMACFNHSMFRYSRGVCKECGELRNMTILRNDEKKPRRNDFKGGCAKDG